MEGDLMSSIYRKIEREKALIQAAMSMRQSTDNASVNQSLESNIRESQKNIAYLEDQMRKVQDKHLKGGMDNLSLDAPPPPPKGDQYRPGGPSGGINDNIPKPF